MTLQHLQKVNRVLVWLLPLLVLAAGQDFVRGRVQAQPAAAAILPELTLLSDPALEMPEVRLSDALFVLPKPKKVQAAVVPPEDHPIWRLKGVYLGGTRRAFLEDEKSGRTLWVQEGEQLGQATIQQVQERSVRLIEGGETIEIRM